MLSSDFVSFDKSCDEFGGCDVVHVLLLFVVMCFEKRDYSSKILNQISLNSLCGILWLGFEWEIVEDLSGGLRRNRTTDTKIFSLLLYRLSYQALKLKAEFYSINLKIKLKVVIISPKT